jgi:hypothetical protein
MRAVEQYDAISSSGAEVTLDMDYATIEQDVRRRVAGASRRAGRQFRAGMSAAEKAAIHAAELRRVGIRDERFTASALISKYEELAHAVDEAGFARQIRQIIPSPRRRTTASVGASSQRARSRRGLRGQAATGTSGRGRAERVAAAAEQTD